jgi:predicted transcriptional regulator
MMDFLRKDQDQSPPSLLSSYKQDVVRRSGNIRDEIYDFVERNPGIRYRELTRIVGISNGVLTYHLGILEKFGQIKVARQSNNRVTRYFIANIPKEDSDIIGYFRSIVTRDIVFFVLKNEFCTFNEIVEHVRKAPSTVSWHIKRLKEAGIFRVVYGDERQLYSLTNKTLVSGILLKYKQSFTDKIIDNYTEMVDKL